MEHVLCEQSPVFARMLAEEWRKSGEKHDTICLQDEDPDALKLFGKPGTETISYDYMYDPR
jgi:hypothetical protein